jgi:flagellar biosynthesis protein FlhG
MNDHALELRQVLREAPTPEPEAPGPPVVVLGSGKGGVGKSVVAVLGASALADCGHRVLLLDGCQNLGHLPVLLGTPVRARLEQMARGETGPESMVHRVNDHLWLVPSDSGAEGLYGLGAVESARLHHRLSGLYDGFDAVVVDAGPGIEGVVRLSTMRGTRLVVVTVPEAAALTDAYALVKLVHLQLPSLPIDVLVNRAASAADAQAAYERLGEAADRFLGRRLGSAGWLPETPAVHDALREPGGLLRSRALADFRREVARLDLVGSHGRNALEGVSA